LLKQKQIDRGTRGNLSEKEICNYVNNSALFVRWRIVLENVIDIPLGIVSQQFAQQSCRQWMYQGTGERAFQIG
jgi:hypothetical protein